MATKTNNIHCEVGDEPGKASLMCNIFRRSGPVARPKPADCAASWGHALFIKERGPVEMLCLEEWDNNWPGNVKFQPSETADFGGISCEATRYKVECKNRDGHGFLLSRREQKVF